MKTIYILLILICLVVILISILLLLYFHKKNINQIKKQLIIIKERTSLKKEIIINTSLKRVGIIAQSNKDVLVIFKQLNDIYKSFFLKWKLIKNLILKLENKTTNFKYFSNKFKPVYFTIKSEFETLNMIEKKFNNLSSKVLKYDEILRTEFNIYQKFLRKVIDLYEEKKLFFDKFIDKIDNFKHSIKHIGKEFEIVIDNGDIQKSFILIQRYIQKIITFAKLINNGPSLITQINIQIPQFIKKINELYLNNKKIIGLTFFQNIEFESKLKKIINNNISAKKQLSNLEIEKSIIKIKNILKNIQKLENQVITEIKTKNKFILLHKIIISEAKKTIDKWILIDQQFKEIVGSGKIFEPEIIQNYNQLKDTLKILDNNFLIYQNIILNKNKSYTDKIIQTQKLIIFIKKGILQINIFIDIIWKIDLKNINLKNKFIRSENAIHEIISISKRRNIILLPNEQKIINDVLKQKIFLAQNLKIKTNNQIKDEIEKFSENTKNIYIYILSKIQMAFHIKNIIKILSVKRAINKKLNIGLKQVETKYLEGKYTSGFNEIIDCLKDVNMIF